jgi:hypothetical protein
VVVSWLRSSDSLLRDPRILELTLEDIGALYLSGLHCATFATDGYITVKSAKDLFRAKARTIIQHLLEHQIYEERPCEVCKELRSCSRSITASPLPRCPRTTSTST